MTMVGARQPEQHELVRAWRPPEGPAPVVGGGRTTSVEAAAWLNAMALVRLEMDEGHKFAAGHPLAHGLPAVLALAADLGSSGEDTVAALVATYEVAARFGRATRLRSGFHPHGSWGVAGAAAGCARLLGLDAAAVAAAIDTGAGLPIAGHFSSALDGNPVRDAWMAASNLSGLAAARMAAAGVARCTGTAASSLGELVGSFDPLALDDALGERWDIELGYFKRHASCSFTHPVADAALELRAGLADPTDVDEVMVETHFLASGLDRTYWNERLGALFSIPFVVAAALVHGRVDPSVSAPEHLHDPRVRELAGKVTVRRADDLDARLPGERAARVRLTAGGRTHQAEVPNPVGDAAYRPLSEQDVLALLAELLGDRIAVRTVHEVARELPACEDVTSTLQRLAGV
ncbi:2-methylcitrate dehydratase PrpD [Nonomuraea thailandensis]|uniref:2-methylcitrate dehydratase PrpD n=1 Tax=Nonomuraea thailandensis TaxID=1188745 RepID=A0A9X2G970_9ACTN|nr:2-methylcitrate dehydratase PrpD [Nonomuraea thailandensis]